MIAAFIILTALIALLPALIMVDGILANGVISAIVAIAMVTVVFTLHTSELNRFSRLLRPTVFPACGCCCRFSRFRPAPWPTRSG